MDEPGGEKTPHYLFGTQNAKRWKSELGGAERAMVVLAGVQLEVGCW